MRYRYTYRINPLKIKTPPLIVEPTAAATAVAAESKNNGKDVNQLRKTFEQHCELGNNNPILMAAFEIFLAEFQPSLLAFGVGKEQEDLTRSVEEFLTETCNVDAQEPY